MANTAQLNLFYPTAIADDLPYDEYAKLVQGYENFHLAVGEALGSGCYSQSDFQISAVAGALQLQITGKRAIVGGTGARRLVYQSGTVTIGVAEGITASATNYVFLKKDGTFVVNTTGTNPTGDAELIGTAVFGTTDATSVNTNPAGRRNIIDLIPVTPSLSAGAEASNQRVVTLQLVDLSGNSLAARKLVKLWISDAQWGGEAASAPNGGVTIGAGTALTTITANKQYEFITNASGQVQITVQESTVKTFWVHAAHGGGIASLQLSFT